MIVEAFLGHADRLHPYGESSCWIPHEILARVAPLVSEYMAANGWSLVEASWAQRFKSKRKQVAPEFRAGKQGYEGRQLHGSEALLRAKVAIRSVIDIEQLESDRELELDRPTIVRIESAIKASSDRPGDVAAILHQWKALLERSTVSVRFVVNRGFLTARHDGSGLLDGDLLVARDVVRAAIRKILPEDCRGGDFVEFDDDNVSEIRKAAEASLIGDERALAKLREAIAGVVGSFRRKAGFRVTATALNLTRVDAGPVPITAARHLAIATHVVEALPSAIRDYLEAAKKDRSTQSLKHLAGVVVILIVCDAVLNVENVSALVEEIQACDASDFTGQLQLRATVTNPRAVYDRTVDCTHPLAAALLGYGGARVGGGTIAIEKVMQEADRLVQRIVGREHLLDLVKLAEVMKPYWFLRLPGSNYAHCAGKYECNAPSPASVRLLLGGKPTELVLPKKVKPSSWSKEDASSAAVEEVNAMMKAVRKNVEDGDSASPNQRKRLREALNKKLTAALIELTCSFQVVDLWVNFLRYLLVVGGIRVRQYAFGSIDTYQGRILKPLLEVAWTVDVLSLDADGFDALYSKVLDRIALTMRADAKTVLRLFHAFLRSWFGADRCSVLPAAPRRKRLARNVVLPDRCITAALESLPVTSASARMIAICNGYGTRTEEAYGALRRDFLDRWSRAFRVRRNSIRSVKTFERTIPISKADALSEHVLKKARAKTSAVADADKEPLCASPTLASALTPYADATGEAILALKRASGESAAILYSLRHTFTDAVAFYVLIDSPWASPIAVAMGKALNVSPTTAFEIKTCYPDKSNFPFQMDRLGMWLGQAGISTLLTTYFHTSWSICGEYCARNALSMALTPRELAALLGVSRSRIAQLQGGLPKEKGLQEQLAAVVKGFVQRRGFDRLVDAPDESIESQAERRPQLDFPLPVADAVLVMWRRNTDGQEEFAREVAQDFLVSESMVRAFLNGYLDVANPTGFVDFEPDENRSGRSARVGVDRGHARRQRMLATVEERVAEDPEFLVESAAVAKDWLDSVNGTEPMLVSRSLESLKQHAQWLAKLGYKESQLVVRNFRGDDAAIKESLGKTVFVEAVQRPVGRLGMIGAHAEFGLTVATTADLPGDRDLQRVIFCLTCWLKSGIVTLQ